MLDNQRPMFNRFLARNNVTLFCKYGFVGTPPTSLASVYLPCYLTGVVLEDLGIVQLENSSAGDYTLRYDTTGKISRAYRVIDGVEYNLSYVDELVYNGLTNDEQLRECFTFSRNYIIANKVITPIEVPLPERLLIDESFNVFLNNKSLRYDIDGVEVEHSDKMITVTGNLV